MKRQFHFKKTSPVLTFMKKKRLARIKEEPHIYYFHSTSHSSLKDFFSGCWSAPVGSHRAGHLTVVLYPKNASPQRPPGREGESMSILLRFFFILLFSSFSAHSMWGWDAQSGKYDSNKGLFVKVFSWSLLIDCLTENSTETERRTEILSEKH